MHAHTKHCIGFYYLLLLLFMPFEMLHPQLSLGAHLVLHVPADSWDYFPGSYPLTYAKFVPSFNIQGSHRAKARP
jgi:hypothetical protein